MDVSSDLPDGLGDVDISDTRLTFQSAIAPERVPCHEVELRGPVGLSQVLYKNTFNW